MKLSAQQKNWIAAKALYEIAYEASRANDKLIDAEAKRQGLPTPYAILAEDHPLMVKGQELLDDENAARKIMYQAAYALFDWGLEVTFAKCGTPKQQAEIKKAVETIKEKAHVEKLFQDLVNLNMKLAA